MTFTNEFRPEDDPNPDDPNALGNQNPQIAWSEEGTPLASIHNSSPDTRSAKSRRNLIGGSGLPAAYLCACGGKVVRGLLYDHLDIGTEWQWICRGPCGRTHGPSWIENLWGNSESPTVLDLDVWTEIDPLPITRQMLLPHAGAWSAKLIRTGAAGVIAYLLIALVLNGIGLRVTRALSAILL